MIRKSKAQLSFRTKALLVSFALQCLFVVIFATAVLFTVANRGASALRDNLAAATSGYASNAAFIFISSFEGNRAEFLAAAAASPNIEAAFMTDTDYNIIMITDEPWRGAIEAARASILREIGASVIDRKDYWIFYEPVYAKDTGKCGDLGVRSDMCAAEAELLGYLGVVGGKGMIRSLTWNIAFIVLAAAAVLLGFIYWATNRLSDRLYRPMLKLVAETRKTADHGYRDKLNFSGPPEVEAVAAAIDHLIDRASENAEELVRQVAEKTREEREARAIAEKARVFAEGVKEWRTSLMAVNTHELLTPLRILIGELDIAIEQLRFLEKGRTSETIANRLYAMREPIQRIEEIVAQVNMAMQIEEGRIEVHPTLEDIQPMMGRLQALHGPAATRGQNRLLLDNGLGAPIMIDHRMVETIASNLVSNACKFTHGGEIKLTVHQRHDDLLIACVDTGAGIPEDKKALIFEPLYQADMSSRRVADGLGLGLSIVKGFVDRLGGAIDLESSEGAGTRIVVRLPLPAATIESTPAVNS